jgi:hypothetical protein
VRERNCKHRSIIDDTRLGDPCPTAICRDCGKRGPRR